MTNKEVEKWMEENDVGAKREAAERVARKLVDDAMMDYLNETGQDNFGLTDVGLVTGAVLERMGQKIRGMALQYEMALDDVFED